MFIMHILIVQLLYQVNVKNVKHILTTMQIIIKNR